jgi:hypothetical protein
MWFGFIHDVRFWAEYRVQNAANSRNKNLWLESLHPCKGQFELPIPPHSALQR